MPLSSTFDTHYMHDSACSDISYSPRARPIHFPQTVSLSFPLRAAAGCKKRAVPRPVSEFYRMSGYGRNTISLSLLFARLVLIRAPPSDRSSPAQ